MSAARAAKAVAYSFTCLGGAGGELGGEHEVREDVDGEGRLQVLRRAAQWQRLHACAQQRALDALRQVVG